MKKIAIVSLRFAPGHIAHLRAYRELFIALGCDIRMFLDSGYKGFIADSDDIGFIDAPEAILLWQPDMVFSYNIAGSNIQLAKKCRRENIPFYYVLHEPWDSFKELISLRQRMPRRVAANVVNYLTAHYARKVILASENGKQKFLKYMKNCNKNYAVFPLIFCDDYDETKHYERQFFSFIGGFTDARACGEFLEFVKYSIYNALNIKFCIATRNSIEGYLTDPTIKQAVDEKLLYVFAGIPMTSEEINQHYREAVCAWNAYKSSTQSGVLPNALMQGAPVLVTDRGDSRNIITEKKEGCFISVPHNNAEIEQAYSYIRSHVNEMSEAARTTFHEKYEYSVYLDRAKEVYEIG